MAEHRKQFDGSPILTFRIALERTDAASVTVLRSKLEAAGVEILHSSDRSIDARGTKEAIESALDTRVVDRNNHLAFDPPKIDAGSEGKESATAYFPRKPDFY